MALAGVPLDRAAVALLRQVADSEPLRPGGAGTAPGRGGLPCHTDRAATAEAGYVTRVPDPVDRRAQRIRLTDAGREAVDRVREAGARGMQLALAGRRAEDLRQMATLYHRMVDDFLAYTTDEDSDRDADDAVTTA